MNIAGIGPEFLEVLRREKLNVDLKLWPSLLILAHKYKFKKFEIEVVEAIQNAFTAGLGADLTDERIVFALFFVICPYFGYVSMFPL